MNNLMVKLYSEKSKEELVQEIMALKEIECKDRCFANQCQSGTAIYDINELFSALEDMKSGFAYEKVVKVCELMDAAKESWDYIKSGIAKINDGFRCEKTLEDLKQRVTAEEEDI